MVADLACSVIGVDSATLLGGPPQRQAGGAKGQGAGSCLIGLASPE